jgi:methionyl-tRNA formyltransferase
MTGKKIIFMGTGPFAYEVLKHLYYSDNNLLLVYTKKPQPQGRGMQIMKNSVQLFAENFRIPVETPESLRNSRENLLKFEADLIVVASYGLIIPPDLLSLYKYGAINLHPSNLPKWRGAAPIERSMMAGDTMTALCVMRMDAGLDTGDIFLKKQIPLDMRFTAQELTLDYAQASTCMLLDVLDNMDICDIRQQDKYGITYAHKIQSDDERIVWDEDGEKIIGRIMALSPKAFCYYKDHKLKIIEAELIKGMYHGLPGQIVSKQFEVVSGDGSIIKINKIQKPGGKILDIKAFLCGMQFAVGDFLL